MSDREENAPAAADAQEERTGLAGVAASIADATGPVISAARKPVDALAGGARRMIEGRTGARVRRIRRRARDPLPNLWDLHPEAFRASIRQLGIHSVPVDQVLGTAVEGPGQRGRDFLPLRERRSDDWRSRWQRILQATDQLVALPPVDLIKFGDEYWVVDGHNRVAAALYNGQVEIDAEVQELRLPGMPSRPPSMIASVLEGSLDLREAGAGRFSRTLSRPTNRLPQDLSSDPHANHQRAADKDESAHGGGPVDDEPEPGR